MQTYHERMKARIERREAFPVPWWLGVTKRHLPEFAGNIGVRTPKRFFTGTSTEFKDFNLPVGDFVLKPDFGHTSKGVQLLNRNENGEISRIFDSNRIERSEVHHEIEAVEREFKVPQGKGQFILEEFLWDAHGKTMPWDFRAFMFQGECAFYSMERKDRESGITTYGMFNPDFTVIPTNSGRFGKHPKANTLHFTELPPPKNIEALANVARRVSVAIPTAFARIDLYDSYRGIMLGEVTLTPGSFYYGTQQTMAEFESRRLGRMWTEAEDRLWGSKIGGAR